MSLSVVLYVRISLKHLWGAVLKRATEIVKELLGRHHGSRSEVYEPNVETFVDDDVLIFNVPVKDVLGPQIEDSSHQLGRDMTSSLTNKHFTFESALCFHMHFLSCIHTCLKM